MVFAPVAVIVFAAVTGCGGGVRTDTGTQFGTAGKVRTDFGGDDVADALAIQADGKIVAAGHKGHAFALARYAPDGELDGSFGTAGRVVTDFGARPTRFVEGWQRGVNGLAILPDGKIIVAGAGPREFALARYTPNGRLDGSFGRGGLVFTRFQAGSEDYAEALAVQTDGKIVAAGRSFQLFALARYLPSGRLDATFGRGGKALPNVLGDDYDVAEGVALQVDGKIIAAGWTGPRFPGAIVARLTSRGRLDPSFGSGGIASGASPGAAAVAIARDGKVITAGFESHFVNPCCSNRSVENLLLYRYAPDGHPDPTFGKRGAVQTRVGHNLQVTAVAIDGDGKVVVAGGSGRSDRTRDFLLVRYGRDGSIDS